MFGTTGTFLGFLAIPLITAPGLRWQGTCWYRAQMVTAVPIPKRNVETFTACVQERRKRQRVMAQWPLQIWNRQEYVLGACTANASSSGLYCICPGRFLAGETLTALLEIPAPGTNGDSSKLTLRCEVVVVRVEPLDGDGECGVAFEIANYSVVRH
ncbi:MAG: PilZ domain-containing protein [Bryobacteraceae bacterium]